MANVYRIYIYWAASCVETNQDVLVVGWGLGAERREPLEMDLSHRSWENYTGYLLVKTSAEVYITNVQYTTLHTCIFQHPSSMMALFLHPPDNSTENQYLIAI